MSERGVGDESERKRASGREVGGRMWVSELLSVRRCLLCESLTLAKLQRWTGRLARRRGRVKEREERKGGGGTDWAELAAIGAPDALERRR